MLNRELRRERILFNREKAIKVIIIMMRMMVMMTEAVIMTMMEKRVMMKMTTMIKTLNTLVQVAQKQKELQARFRELEKQEQV